MNWMDWILCSGGFKPSADAEWLREAEKEYDRICREVREDVERWREAKHRKEYAGDILPPSRVMQLREESKMQKEYEYKATGGLGPYDIAKYNPCDTEFGKFSKWFYSLTGGYSSEQLIAKLVEEKRFGWLDWLAEHTPFVTRTEKKPAYKFTPENLKLEFYKDGGAALMMYDEKGDDWWYTLHFVPGEPISRSEDVGRVPVPLDGDSKVRVR